MNKKELKAVVERLLAKGNKRSEEQIEKYGFVFDKGFEAHEVDGRCARANWDSNPKKGNLCHVKIGDPIIFDAYFEGSVNVKIEYQDIDWNGDKTIDYMFGDIEVWEQNGKYAITSTNCFEDDVISHIKNLQFEDSVEVDIYKKQL